MPKISIITTTYNHQDFIAETIESVISQTFTDWELLIGDDSTNNDTWDIIQKYVEQYPEKIKAWHHSANKGMIGNINFLLSKISTDAHYVAFLEGDDIFSDTNISEKITIFNKYENIGVVTSATRFIDGNSAVKNIPNFGTPEYHQKEGMKKSTTLDMLFGMQTPVRSFGNVMIKKSLLARIDSINLGKYSDEKMFIPYDFIFWLNIFPATEVYHTKKKLFTYRFHENNNSDLKFFKTSLNQMAFIYSLYKDKYPKEILYLSRLIESKIYALEGKNKESLIKLLKSITLFPLKNFSYKASILLDILRIKKIIIKILFISGCKQ